MKGCVCDRMDGTGQARKQARKEGGAASPRCFIYPPTYLPLGKRGTWRGATTRTRSLNDSCFVQACHAMQCDAIE